MYEDGNERVHSNILKNKQLYLLFITKCKILCKAREPVLYVSRLDKCSTVEPTNTWHRPIVGPMLGQRLHRSTNGSMCSVFWDSRPGRERVQYFSISTEPLLSLGIARRFITDGTDGDHVRY